jgi:hypothetical protein
VRAAALLLFLFEAKAAGEEPAPEASPKDGLVRIDGKGTKTEKPATAGLGGALPAALAGEGLARMARTRNERFRGFAVRSLSAWEAERDPARRTEIAQQILQDGTQLPEAMREIIAGAIAGERRCHRRAQSPRSTPSKRRAGGRRRSPRSCGGASVRRPTRARRRRPIS